MSYSSLSPSEEPQFNSGAVRPFACLSEGWHLVKDQYFLFVGMFLIIVILVTCIPFTGLIYGAWMIGIYGAMLGRMRGEPASFNALGKGFSFFSQGFVIALLSGAPFVLITIGAKLMELRFAQIDRDYPGSKPVPDEVMIEMIVWFGGLVVLFGFFYLITGVIFPFAYQLAAERNLSGWQATRLSARAAGANFGGVLGLVVLELILGTIGILLCYIGVGLVLPLTKGAWTVAYRQVFPPPPQEQFALMPFPPPPPPPPFPGQVATDGR
jgi:hypothetical protein